MNIPVTYDLHPTEDDWNRFKKEYPSARTCPKCGFKYHVTTMGIFLAYVKRTCSICKDLPMGHHAEGILYRR